MYIDVAGKYSGNAFGRLVSDNGLTANLYEQNGCAIKVFNLNYKKEAVYREAYIMSLIESLGIKLARVYQTGLRDGHHYIEMEYLNGPVQMDLMLQAIAADDKDGFFRLLREMTLIQLKIHSKPGVGLNSYCDLAAARIRASRHLDERQKQQT
ncbi:MAG: hypothetical protein IJL39_00440, partial [Clostridia bacterium]|nr:hypothetical protein [Clostridia bacterium]